MSGISLASSPFTAGNVLPNTHTVNTGGNSHLYASKQAGGKNQKQQQKRSSKAERLKNSLVNRPRSLDKAVKTNSKHT